VVISILVLARFGVFHRLVCSVGLPIGDAVRWLYGNASMRICGGERYGYRSSGILVRRFTVGCYFHILCC